MSYIRKNIQEFTFYSIYIKTQERFMQACNDAYNLHSTLFILKQLYFKFSYFNAYFYYFCRSIYILANYSYFF